MRGATTERGTSALVWLISSLLAAFVLEVFFRTIGVRAGPDLTGQTALTVSGFQNGRLWTVLTHAWLHSTENLLHIIAVVAGLALLGRELIPDIGSKKFLIVFFAGILTGALTWCAINWNRGGVLIGASSGVFCLLAFYTLRKPTVELNFLLFFFISFIIYT
jgi:membrane associated rhomboid family serine protease